MCVQRDAQSDNMLPVTSLGVRSYESLKKSYMRKAALTTQGVSLKFPAIISFKFAYVCFSLISRGTCCGGFWQQCCGG